MWAHTCTYIYIYIYIIYTHTHTHIFYMCKGVCVDVGCGWCMHACRHTYMCMCMHIAVFFVCRYYRNAICCAVLYCHALYCIVYVCIYVCICVWMAGRMDVCMCVFTYLYVHTLVCVDACSQHAAVAAGPAKSRTNQKLLATLSVP